MTGPPDVRAETVRRLALVQLVVGVPALLFVVFGLVVGYRLADRPLGDAAFWSVLVPVVVAFALYFAHAILRLRRATGGRNQAATTSEEQEP